jgi:hypothetical protein
LRSARRNEQGICCEFRGGSRVCPTSYFGRSLSRPAGVGSIILLRFKRYRSNSMRLNLPVREVKVIRGFVPLLRDPTGHIMMRSAPRYVVRVRLRMSSGALPGPDLLRAIPGVLRRGATGARVRASRGGLGTSINLPVISYGPTSLYATAGAYQRIARGGNSSESFCTAGGDEHSWLG